jgi:transcriptional regulator MraZ
MSGPGPFWIRNGKKWYGVDQQGSPAAGERVFRGVYEHQIDAKGRTSLPAKLRETLVGAYDERLIVTTALDPCLHAYPVREWELLESSLATRNPMEPGVKTLMRLYVAPAQECPVDKLGRILIPPTLRAHAGLEKDVVWAGMVKVIEVWSKDGWRRAQEDARGAADSADVMRVLTELRQGREQS